MQIAPITPSRAVDNAFLQETIASANFRQFRSRLLRLLNQADEAVQNEESEEHLKNLIKPFLNNTNFGEDYSINTKDRQDLAIHNGKTRSSTVGVILEAKRPSNKEMITAGDVNRKAFHEAILYYLRERIENGNEDIKHIIITDVYRWFVFDAQDFERHFYDSGKLRGWFDEWKQGQKVSSKTQFVYNHLSEFVDGLDVDMKATRFDIRDFKSLLEKDKLNRDEQKKLVPLFKFFTPTHLLKLPFASDSNNLNKGFYRELLYIMGLQEYKEKGTHYITRLDEGDRHPASLIENTITQLKSLSVLSQISGRAEYGETEEEQLFNVAIQLLITWINRILFLKLLEAQLYKYHQEDERFRFLSHRQIEEYDDLNKLFFQVLAVPDSDRSKRIAKNYGHIPYLNSSLFDVADIEREAVRISELEDGLEMPVYARSKIRNKSGERLKGESISGLEYLLRFLDAYSFNTEGTAEVQDEAKTLINASVLGRIFEKINGYKDGSFFTPGYITEYMCRETIRRAVVQKFNEAFEDWDCEDMDDLRGLLARHEVPYSKANAIVNSTTVCDPAVGSGHFLVSALNELIAIKHDLRIFVDEKNERFRDVDISVDNDELRISVGSDPFFEYRVQHRWKETGGIKRTVGTDTQRLQKALFREKNILIENCLFGVDINPNSVNICRLRLWVELLKHAYYKESEQEEGARYRQLEVLPNIDINIKQGNSLVSRFGLDADLSSVFKDSDHSVDDYKEAVQNYKHTRDRAEKRRLQTYIDDVKEAFSTTLMNNRPINKKLSKARGTLEVMNNADLFGDTKFTKKQIKQQQKEVKQLEETKAEEESGVFYNQAFEWRFEFPEVLDEDGNFTGFDAVIGNPPYVAGPNLEESKDFYREEYSTAEYQLDLYIFFIEQGKNLLKENGLICLITPNSWLKNLTTQKCRKFILENLSVQTINPNLASVFEEAQVDTLIFLAQNEAISNSIRVWFFKNEEVDIKHEIKQERFYESEDLIFNVEVDEYAFEVLSKIKEMSDTFEDHFDITRGVNPYDKYRGQSQKIIKDKAYHASIKKDETFVPELRGKHVQRFIHEWDGKHFISFGDWLAAPRDPKYYEGDRIVLREILGDKFVCTLIEEDLIIDRSLYIAKIESNKISAKYALGILSSQLLSWFFRYERNEFDDLFPKIRISEFRKLPIIVAEDQNPLVDLVDKILSKKQDNPKDDTSELEAEIDQLVYELYGLSEEEIAIVEQGRG